MEENNMELFTNNTTREVYCADANIWLTENCNNKIIITSLPDMDEVNLNYNDWINWISITCNNLIKSLSTDGIIFFYQTDRKYKGILIDKKSLISNIFISNRFNNIFSKIILKQNPNTINLFRPTYTNLFAFSKKITSGKSTPDVIYCGKMLYKNAMGFNAVECCINFLKAKNIHAPVIDPFCGMGSVLKISNELGYNSIGIDILKEQTKIAKNI